ncbi:MAG: hypothetical protein V9G09_15580 [Candidatus Nanopelagicales bacterium]
MPLLGDIPLAEVGAGEVEALHEMLAAAGISTALARRIHATLSSALADAERDGLIAQNPCAQGAPTTWGAVRTGGVVVAAGRPVPRNHRR